MIAELAYRCGLQPSELGEEPLDRAGTVYVLERVRELHRDDADLAMLCAEVAAGSKEFT